MFCLISDLWSIQHSNGYQHQMNIPQTIVLLPTKPLQINWYFSGQENRIFRRKGEKVTLKNVYHFFKKLSSSYVGGHKIVASIFSSEGEQFDGFQEGLIKEHIATKFVGLNELHEFLMHHHEYPNLLERTTIIQEYQHDFSKLSCSNCQIYMSVSWNPNYNFVQQCNEKSTNTNLLFTKDQLDQQKTLKLSPHFRGIIDKTTNDIIQKIDASFCKKRGKVQSADLIFKIFEDRLQFIWCSQISFEKDVLIRNIEYQQGKGSYWQKANQFRLQFQENSNDNNKSDPFKQKVSLKLKLDNSRCLPQQGSQTDRSYINKDTELDCLTSDNKINKSKSINRIKFKVILKMYLQGGLFNSGQFSIINQLTQVEIRQVYLDYQSLAIIRKVISTFQTRINKNRSHSFCRTIKTVQESLDLKGDTSGSLQVNNSARIRSDSSRQPFSLKLNNLLDQHTDQQFLTQRNNLKDMAKNKTSFCILRKITGSLERSYENNVTSNSHKQLQPLVTSNQLKLNQNYLVNRAS